VPYLLDQFNYFFETPFDTIDPGFGDCSMDRKNKADNDGKVSMYLVNHYLDIKIPETGILMPDRLSAPRTNAPEGPGSIGAHARLCLGVHGRIPNVMLLDYFGRGGVDSLAAQNSLNAI
jgi:hypothetical protein